MLTPLEAARRSRENPLWPYSWAVRYRDGTRVAQYDAAGGYHLGTEIDPRQVVRLEILGHPESPIPLYPPHDDPDEVVLRARVQRALVPGVGWQESIWRLFGWRYGTMGYVLRIDDAGSVEIGVIDPITPGARGRHG
jgi:hypothetical protein